MDQAPADVGLTFKDQACRRAMGENPPARVGDPTFGGPDPAAAVQDDALGLYQTRFRRDRPHQRNLELDGRLTDAPVQGRMDREAHAAVEQRRRQAAMRPASGVAVPFVGDRRCDNAAFGNLDDVITESFRHCVQGQGAADEFLDKLEAAHLDLPVGADRSIGLVGDAARHGLPRCLRKERLAACLRQPRNTLDFCGLIRSTRGRRWLLRRRNGVWAPWTGSAIRSLLRLPAGASFKIFETAIFHLQSGGFGRCRAQAARVFHLCHIPHGLKVIGPVRNRALEPTSKQEEREREIHGHFSH